MIPPIGRHGAIAHNGFVRALLPLGAVAAGAVIALITMCKVDLKGKITLRDSSQSLAGIQNVLELVGMVLREFK